MQHSTVIPKLSYNHESHFVSASIRNALCKCKILCWDFLSAQKWILHLVCSCWYCKILMAIAMGHRQKVKSLCRCMVADKQVHSAFDFHISKPQMGQTPVLSKLYSTKTFLTCDSCTASEYCLLAQSTFQQLYTQQCLQDQADFTVTSSVKGRPKHNLSFTIAMPYRLECIPGPGLIP